MRLEVQPAWACGAGFRASTQPRGAQDPRRHQHQQPKSICSTNLKERWSIFLNMGKLILQSRDMLATRQTSQRHRTNATRTSVPPPTPSLGQKLICAFAIAIMLFCTKHAHHTAMLSSSPHILSRVCEQEIQAHQSAPRTDDECASHRYRETGTHTGSYDRMPRSCRM